MEKNIFSTLLFLFVFINFANSNENSGIPEQIEMISASSSTSFHIKHNPVLDHRVHVISGVLADFRHKYPQFDYGIRSMEGLYDVIENPEIMHEKMKEHTCVRSIVVSGEVLVGGACEIVKSLSVFHPESYGYGNALVVLYFIKSVLWGIDSWLYGTDKEASAIIMNALQTDPLMISNVSAMSSQVSHIDFFPVTKIATNVINLVQNEDLSEEDNAKLNRLIKLNKKLQNTRSTKNILFVGGKVLSFLTGIAAGISITASGQDSNPSYWLTLIAGGLDSIADNVHTNITKKPITQRYITISEILFLSDFFLEKYREGIV